MLKLYREFKPIIMKTKHLFLFVIFFSLAGLSCNKEKTYNVRYEVETNSPSNTSITWTTSDGGISGGTIFYLNWNNSNEVYRYTFTGPEGMDIYFSGINTATGNPAYVKIRLYIDNALTRSSEGSQGIEAEITYTL